MHSAHHWCLTGWPTANCCTALPKLRVVAPSFPPTPSHPLLNLTPRLLLPDAPCTHTGTQQGSAGFGVQANALLRKSATYQKRNVRTNICLLSSPIFFCLLLLIIKLLVDNIFLTGEDFEVRTPAPAVLARALRSSGLAAGLSASWCCNEAHFPTPSP